MQTVSNPYQKHSFGQNLTLKNTVSKSYSGYTFGFNSMEKDDEVKGQGNSYDFGARMFDSRLGRWLCVDALTNKYPSLSSYSFAGNSPIVLVDPDGNVVKPKGSEAMILLQYMVTPEEAKYIQLTYDGAVNVDLLKQGLIAIGENCVSSNFKDLITVSEATQIIEFTVYCDVMGLDGNGDYKTLIEFSPSLGNEIDDMWSIFDGKLDKTGIVSYNNKDYNYEGFKKELISWNFKDEEETDGIQGATLLPKGFEFTLEDQNNLKSSSPEKQKFSADENISITINSYTYEKDKLKATKAGAHELFGHALMAIIGQSLYHGTNRKVDNQPLENQINKTVNNASENYNLHDE